MKIKEKLLSLLLATVLALCVTVVFAFADDTLVIGQSGFKYKLDPLNSTATLIGPDGECPAEVRIPSIVDYNGDGYAVTDVGDGAFKDCTELISIVLPPTVRRIGPRAFLGCSHLTTVTLPRTANYNSRHVFTACPRLHALFYTPTFEPRTVYRQAQVALTRNPNVYF